MHDGGFLPLQPWPKAAVRYLCLGRLCIEPCALVFQFFRFKRHGRIVSRIVEGFMNEQPGAFFARKAKLSDAGAHNT